MLSAQDVGQRVHFPNHAVHAPFGDVRHLVGRRLDMLSGSE